MELTLSFQKPSLPVKLTGNFKKEEISGFKLRVTEEGNFGEKDVDVPHWLESLW
jgi:hypothetical protein